MGERCTLYSTESIQLDGGKNTSVVSPVTAELIVLPILPTSTITNKPHKLTAILSAASDTSMTTEHYTVTDIHSRRLVMSDALDKEPTTAILNQEISAK